MDIRVVDFDGEPWFVAKDVREALGLNTVANAHNHLRVVSEDEKMIVRKKDTLGISLPDLFPGTTARIALLSESGLYKLVMRSDKPHARAFQDWVTKVVLPTIRKDGMYVAGEEKVSTGAATRLLT